MSKTKNQRIAELEARVAMLESKRAATPLEPTKPTGRMYEAPAEGTDYFYVTGYGAVVQDACYDGVDKDLLVMGSAFHDRESAEKYAAHLKAKQKLRAWCKEQCAKYPDKETSYLHWNCSIERCWYQSFICSEFKVPRGVSAGEHLDEEFLKLALTGGDL